MGESTNVDPTERTDRSLESVKNIDTYEREKVEATLAEVTTLQQRIANFLREIRILDRAGIMVGAGQAEPRPSLDSIRKPGAPADPDGSIRTLTRMFENQTLYLGVPSWEEGRVTAARNALEEEDRLAEAERVWLKYLSKTGLPSDTPMPSRPDTRTRREQIQDDVWLRYLVSAGLPPDTPAPHRQEPIAEDGE